MVLTAMVCTLGLAACTGAETSGRIPPALYLNCGSAMTAVSPGSYSWSYRLEDGTMEHAESGAAHSPQDQEGPCIEAATVSLQFQGEPDRVTVQRWDADAAAEGVPSEGEALPVRVVIEQDMVKQLLDLEPGSYSYAITLYWEETETLRGSATYYFHTVKPGGID